MTRALLAKVHIAKKELALPEESYRAILSRVTGHESSANCTEEELERLLAEFRRLGWVPKQGTRAPAPKHVRLIYALWREAGIVGAIDNATKETLRTFVERQTKRSAPEFCSPSEANRVSEALKAMIARVEVTK